MKRKKRDQGNSANARVTKATRIPHRRGEQTADPGIVAVVSSLFRLDIAVSLACEGHPRDQQYSSTPWVDIETNPLKSRRIVEMTVLRLLDMFYRTHRPSVSHARLCLRSTLRLESLGADVANDDKTQTHERIARRDVYLLEMRAFGTFLLSLSETTE